MKLPTHDHCVLIHKIRIQLFTKFGSYLRSGVLKLWISPFLMKFGFLNLEFGNQIWKFICSYFGKFSGQFSEISNFLEFGFSN